MSAVYVMDQVSAKIIVTVKVTNSIVLVSVVENHSSINVVSVTDQTGLKSRNHTVIVSVALKIVLLFAEVIINLIFAVYVMNLIL